MYWTPRSSGGVDGFSAPWFGSVRGTLAAGVTARAMAGSRGSHLILKSNGGVDKFPCPWHGSLTGNLSPGQTVTAIAGQ